MRIECQSCSAKYQVADEKVIGKLFKVRCKKCGAMISVDGTNLGGDESEEATRVYDMNQSSGEAGGGGAEEAAGIWYAVIDGEQSGPFTEAEVEERVSSGMLDADSFVWCDGMGDWERLADNDTFARLFESAAPAAAVPSAQPLGGSAAAQKVESFPSGGYGAISAGERPGAFASAAGAAKSGSADIFSRAPAASSAPDAEDDSMVGARSENSVLFSLDSLTDVRSGGAAPKADVPRTEESGLINLEALISTRNQQSAANEDPLGGPAAAAGPSIAMGAGPALPRPAERSKTALIVIGIAAVLVVALLAAIIIILLSSGDDTPAVAEAPTPAAEETAAAAAPTQEEPAAQAEQEEEETGDQEEETVVEVEEEPEEEPEQVAQADSARQAAGTTQTARTTETRTDTAQREAAPAPARTETTQRTATREPAQEETRSARDRSGGGVDSVLQRVRGGGEEEAAPARSTSRPAASALPERLERSDIQNTVRRYSSRLARCKASDDEAGTYRTRFVIQPSGSVTNAAVDNDNATGRCILGVVRDFSFPRFSGDPIPVANYPIPIN